MLKKSVLTLIPAIILFLPFSPLGTGFVITVITEAFMFTILALSWDLIGGQAGYPSFGNIVFFGIGAYTTGILMNSGLAFPLAMIIGGLTAVIFAIVIGMPVLRLKGHYFAVTTLGVMLVTHEIAANLRITGGGSGMTVPFFRGEIIGPEMLFYFIFFAIAGVTFFTYRYIMKTKLGLILNAIRDDETKANAMGIKSPKYKILAWAISAFFTGLAGSTYVYYNVFIDPSTALNLDWSVLMIVMTLLGGMGTLLGPVIGAILLRLLSVTLWNYFLGWQYVFLGAITIAVIMGFPQGIMGVLQGRKMNLRELLRSWKFTGS